MRNILFINTANAGGGAEKVCYTICKELHLRGYRTSMLARRIDTEADPLARELVQPVPGGEAMYSLGNFLDSIFSTQYLFYPSTWKIPFLEVVNQADVINLHNIHGYYFNLLTVPFLMSQRPVVWTLHDMWSFTGKCAWSFDCTRYTESCGKCPELAKYPVLRRDTSSFHLWLKRHLYGNKKFVIVTPSAWLQAHVARSILRDIPTFVIHSPIDTAAFYPEDRTTARRRLGIPLDKKVLLFIASWINTIPHKGVGTFLELLRHLYGRQKDLFSLVVGHLEGRSVLGSEFEGKETGFVNDPDLLRACYCAADVFVSPTLAENSSCTVVEAMACGTPTVAFRTGGIPEQIIHNETGLLTPPGERRALGEAVEALLGNPQQRLLFSKSARNRAVENFALEKCIEKYLRVYDEAVRRST